MTFDAIVQEAIEYSVVVSDTDGKKIPIRFIVRENGENFIRAWMYHDQGKRWNGYTNHPNIRFSGSKAAVAHWCLDKAANGY